MTTNAQTSHVAMSVFPSNFLGTKRFASNLPESVKRVGAPVAVPNEYPGQNVDFNWALNYDGVTPLKKAAFRMIKPLDVKIAGLEPCKTTPLKVNAKTAKENMPEAGSEDLDFDTFDEVSQRTKDLLSLSDRLYCPEGHVPGTLTGVRIISNSSSLAPSILAYLDRAPKRDPPPSQSITAYILDGTDEDFKGYAIEEIVDKESGEERSVAAVVVVGKSPKLELVVAGLELCAEGLKEDEEARMKRAAEAEASKEKEE